MIEGMKVILITSDEAMEVSTKLITDELIKRSEELGEQDVADPIVIAKFYQVATTFTWFMISYDKESKNMFCFASLFHDHNDELGYSHVPELEMSVKTHPVARQVDWVEKPLSEAKKEAGL